MSGIFRLANLRLFVITVLCFCEGAVVCFGSGFPAISGFQHTAWTARDGAPSIAACFAQTPDGYLWIGSPLGLFRFDGVQFKKVQSLNGSRLLEGRISTLFTDDEDGLWIGYTHGGASLLKNNQVVSFGKAEGLTANSKVFHFAQDKEGRIWTATQSGLFRLSGKHWEKIGSEEGYNEPLAQEVAVDDDGTVWVLSSQNLLYLSRGSSRFKKAAPQLGGFGFVYRHGGTIWTVHRKRHRADCLERTPYLNGSVVRPDTPGYLIDQSGGLWLENTGDGIYRVADAARLPGHGLGSEKRGVEAFTSRDGLSGNNVLSIFEDRERNVWVGTENGIDRFTPSHFVSVRLPAGATRLSLARGDRASVIVSTFHDAAITIDTEGSLMNTIPVGGTVGAVYRDPNGSLWLSSEHGLLRVSRNRAEHIALPDFHVRRRFEQVLAMTMDKSGALWVSIEDKGVFRYLNKAWQQIDTSFVSSSTAALCAFSDRDGTVWLGYPGDLIVAYSQTGRRAFTRATGLNLGNVKFITQDHGSLWAGGDMGIALFGDNKFNGVHLADQRELSGLSGVVFAYTGDLFITERSGVIRIPSSELEEFRDNPEAPLRYQSLDFPSAPSESIPLSRSVAASDGKLWFISSKGLVWLDPSQEWDNPPPPPVLIKSLSVLNESFDAKPGLIFPPRTKSVHISYAALTLTSPESVRFRCRLEGRDSGWQEAGARREAFYTNLGPGTYVFHVIACNRDDVWNNVGAILTFRISPAFNQTTWFLLLCVVLFCGLTYVLYLLRVRQVIAVYEMRNAERMAERERIARELHDTLLQGVHGLILRFGVLTENYPEGNSTRAALDDTLVRAEKMLIEGRQRVRNLRAETTTVDLPEALSEAGHELTKCVGIPFELLVQGTPRRLRRIVSEEMFNIGREAINNSILHSRCTKIEAELIYSKSLMLLRVRDDGRGLEPAVLSSGRIADHWGLPGMQERADTLGAELKIYSKAGFGTEVELRVPARIAFQKIAPAGPGRRMWRNIQRIIAKGRPAARNSKQTQKS